MPGTAVSVEFAVCASASADNATTATTVIPSLMESLPSRSYRIYAVQSAAVDRVIAEVDRARDEIIDFTARLVRIPTVNPPGADYEACASVIGDQLRAHGAAVHLLPALGRVEHTSEHPRINVVGRHDGVSNGPAVHLNGHFDVVDRKS